MQTFRWIDIRAAAKIAGCDPHELRRRLMNSKPPPLPDHLLDRKQWIGLVTDFILSKPPEFNAELLAHQIYERFVATKAS